MSIAKLVDGKMSAVPASYSEAIGTAWPDWTAQPALMWTKFCGVTPTKSTLKGTSVTWHGHQRSRAMHARRTCEVPHVASALDDAPAMIVGEGPKSVLERPQVALGRIIRHDADAGRTEGVQVDQLDVAKRLRRAHQLSKGQRCIRSSQRMAGHVGRDRELFRLGIALQGGRQRY
jgi:hypothetical protein